MLSIRWVIAASSLALIWLFFIFTLIVKPLNFQSDLLTLLPSSTFSPAFLSAEKKFFQQSKNKLFISITGGHKEQAHDALLVKLATHQKISVENTHFSLNELIDFYADFQGYVSTKSFQQLISNPLNYQEHFIGQLSQLVNPFVSQSLAFDPTLATAMFLTEQLNELSPLSMNDGRLVAANKQDLVVIINIANPSNETTGDVNVIVQAQNTQDILNKHINELSILFPDTQITISGILLHTAENAAKAQFEITVFGSASMVMIVLLVIWAFRSLAPLLWIILTVINAGVAGFCALLWLFPEIHLLTFVFGITLIGIGIDYCFHVLAIHKVTTASEKTKPISSSILLAFFTTAIGYALLFFTPLVLLQQVAAFVIFGLFAAVITSLLLHAQLDSGKPIKSTELPAIHVWSNCHYSHVKTVNRFAVNFALLVIIATFIWPLTFNDNIALLSASSDKLMSAEKKHHRLLGQDGVLRILVEANDLQLLLQREEAISDTLQHQFSNVKINKLSNWIPSLLRQSNNRQQFEKAYNNGVFNVNKQFISDFTLSTQNEFLTVSHFKNRLSSQLIQHQLFETPSGFVSVIEVLGASNEQVKQALSTHYGYSMLFNKQQSLTQVLTTFRLQLNYWLLGVTFFVVLMLAMRFDIVTALKGGFALFASIYLALFISCTVQGQLNLFNVLSAILIIGLAVDYLIFYRVRKLCFSNVMAITLSALSSLFVFGMLIFSDTPAVFSFGLTVTCGLLLIYILAPVVIKEDDERRTV